MDVSIVSKIYRTIDWYYIPETTRNEINQYVKRCMTDISDIENAENGLTEKIWKREWNAVYQVHSSGWYIHFYDPDGYTRFVLQWL